MIYLIILKDYKSIFKIFLKNPGFRPHVARTISEKVTFTRKKLLFWSKTSVGPKTDFFFRGQVTFSKITTFLVFLEKDAQRKTVQYDVLNSSQSFF